MKIGSAALYIVFSWSTSINTQLFIVNLVAFICLSLPTASSHNQSCITSLFLYTYSMLLLMCRRHYANLDHIILAKKDSSSIEEVFLCEGLVKAIDMFDFEYEVQSKICKIKVWVINRDSKNYLNFEQL